MIRVQAPPAPGNYESQVRSPGRTFLAVTANPTNDQWQKHRYWSRIHSYLYQQLRGICSYSASFTPRRSSHGGLDHTSIDHFIPKSRLPGHAYEWTNFRLSRARLNHRKDNFEDVLDPYAIQNGWFTLNFITFALSADPKLPEKRKQQVRETIVRLELNADDAYVTERARAVYGYADGKLSFAQLDRMYPFIAAEMRAQNFNSNFLPRFKIALSNSILRGALVRQGWVA